MTRLSNLEGLDALHRISNPPEQHKDFNPLPLPNIPSHWSIVRFGALFTNRSEKGFSHLLPYSVSQQHGVTPQQYTDEEIVRSSADKSNYKRIAAGDIVYNKMRMWQGAVGVAPSEGIVSPAYVVCAPRTELHQTYFYYLCLSPHYIAEFGKHSYGIVDDMNSLRFENFKTIYAIVPPLHEQRVIASYLDRELATIDALIAKTEALNGLLSEKRTALISHAVAKGLDANVALKGSGMEWLGEIPAHWDVKRLRYVVETGPKKSELRNTSSELEISFLPMPAIGEQGALDLSEVKHVADVYDGYTYFCENDVIVAKITPCFENGKGAIARQLLNGIGFGTTELFVLRPGPDTHSDFIYYLTVSSRFRSVGTISMQGAAGQQRVTNLFIKDYLLGFPPLNEQRAIADYLDRETAKIDRLMSKNDRLIDLLREKRTALISAAVTGKIAIPSVSSVPSVVK